METVKRNADQSLARHKIARAGDLTARSQALQELQETLELADAPLRIECFDVSHIQGTQVVASMVVFEDGLPRKSEYRRFIVRGVAEPGAEDGDDEAADGTGRSSGETVGADGVDGNGGVPSRIDPDTGRPKRFAYPPNLVV